MLPRFFFIVLTLGEVERREGGLTPETATKVEIRLFQQVIAESL